MPAVRKFNPGVLQRDEDLRAQFVVREPEFRILLKVLRGSVGSESCQHLVVVGRRGMGKTMLLARLAGELRTDAELSRRLLPVRFSEENHEILEMEDFWSEALFYLARESESYDREISRELHGAHAEWTPRFRGEELEYRAQAAVLDAADRLGRQLVLMVENLQTLKTGSGDDFGWALRKVLQTEPKIILMGTATSHFRGLYDESAPFYHFFRVLTLEPLDTERCRALWKAVSGESRDRRRIRPLEILTGGNPRLLTIIAEFVRRSSPRHSIEVLAGLIDEHTEYFRGYLDGFARTERRVYVALIDLWRPSTSQEIADRARLDIRTTSALLGRLADRGAVVFETIAKKRRYTAADRLHSLCYRLRRERDHAVDLRGLFRFMDAFYGFDDDSAVASAPNGGDRSVAAPGDGPSGPGAAPGFDPGDFTGNPDLAEPMLAAEPATPYETPGAAAPWGRAETLYGAGRGEEAEALLRRSVTAFDPEDSESLRASVRGSLRLVAGGAPAGTLCDLLGGDEGRAAALQPLLVVLGRLAGREVRAPAEVLAVADDLGRDLDRERQRREPVRLRSGTGKAPPAPTGSRVSRRDSPVGGADASPAGGESLPADRSVSGTPPE